MSERYRRRVQSWLEEDALPEISSLRTTRRSLAASGEDDELARCLMRVEKMMEKGEEGSPLAMLRQCVQEHGSNLLKMTMSPREPLPGARRNVLLNVLEQYHGEVVSESSDSITVRMEDKRGLQQLRSLYNWEWEELSKSQ